MVVRLEARVKLHAVQRAFFESPALFRALAGGRGAGKSHVGAADLLLRAKPGRLYACVAPTYPVLEDASWRTLLALARELNLHADDNRGDLRLWLRTGAEVVGRSADNPERRRGPNLSGAWLDEASQMSEDVFSVTIGSLREQGEAGWLSATYTPRGRQHWTYRRFASGGPDVAHFHAPTRANPFLPSQFEATLRRQYTTQFAAQEVEGLYVEGGGTMVRREWFRLARELPAQVTARVRYWDTACLVAGTMVETVTGPRPIQDIRPGDLVLTRQGYRRVRKAGLTKVADRIVSVRFSNGAVLTGTPDHPVWTENYGWTELGSLCCARYDTNITAEGRPWRSGKGGHGSRTLKRSSSTASLTRAGRAVGTSRRCAGTRPRNGIGRTRCTAPSGGSTTGTYRPAMTFTTGTGITTTTPPTTWNAFPSRLTSGGIGRLPLSTGRPPTGSISGKSPQCFGLVRPTGNTSALSAVSHSSRGGRTRPSFAQSVVAVNSTTVAVPTPVYDLTVDGAPEFFANGILVHNSTTAAENPAACYTAGVLMARYPDGRYGVEDVVRGQWSAGTRDRVIADTADLDRLRYGSLATWREQGPGDAGKDVAAAFVRMLSGHDAHADRVTGNKVERYQPFAAQVEAGNVLVKVADWTDDYLDEQASFPDGAWKDQADASSGAFNKLAGGGDWSKGIGTPGEKHRPPAPPADAFRAAGKGGGNVLRNLLGSGAFRG